MSGCATDNTGIDGGAVTRMERELSPRDPVDTSSALKTEENGVSNINATFAIVNEWPGPLFQDVDVCPDRSRQ